MNKKHMYWIPFLELPDYSNLVLYGAGIFGHNIKNQIEAFFNYNIYFYVDKNKAGNFIDEIPIYKYNALLEKEFDYIIITSISSQKEILQLLLDIGIKRTKIKLLKYTSDYYCFIPNFRNRLLMYCKKVIRNNLFNSLEFLFILSENKEDPNTELINKVLSKSLNNIHTPLQIQLKLYQLYYRYNKMTKKHLINLVKLLEKNADNLENMCATLQELHTIVYYKPDCLYPNYYNDRRKLMKAYCNHIIKAETTFKKEKVHTVKKAALIAFRLGENMQHSPTKLILNYALSFQQYLNYEVEIFVEDSFLYGSNDYLVPPLVKAPVSNQFSSVHESYVDSKIKINYISTIDVKKRIRQLVDKVDIFQPDIVINLCDEYSLSAYILYYKYLIVHIPIQGFCFSTEADIYMHTNKKQLLLENRIYHCVEEEKVIELPVIAPICNEKIVYNREDWNLNVDDFVMITIGFSLEAFMPQEFITDICSMLLEIPFIKWLIVGTKSFFFIEKYFSKLIETKQIQFVEYEQNLTALYNICNIYLNPKRKGGGYSIALAMGCHLPIAMNTFPSAGMTWIGEENTVQGDTTQLIEYVKSICTNKQKQKELGNIMFVRVKKFGMRNFACTFQRELEALL